MLKLRQRLLSWAVLVVGLVLVVVACGSGQSTDAGDAAEPAARLECGRIAGADSGLVADGAVPDATAGAAGSDAGSCQPPACDPAIAVVSGTVHVCAILNGNRTVKCWGYNDDGELG